MPKKQRYSNLFTKEPGEAPATYSSLTGVVTATQSSLVKLAQAADEAGATDLAEQARRTAIMAVGYLGKLKS